MSFSFRYRMENGAYPQELEQWRAAATQALADPEDAARISHREKKADRRRIKELERDLRRIHGSHEHKGRRPPDRREEDTVQEPMIPEESEAAARVPAEAPEDFLGAPPVVADSRSELRRLKRELTAAIEEEEFDIAAKLRDRIRELEADLAPADGADA